MLSEFEMVLYFYYPTEAFKVISLIWICKLFQKFNFNVCVVHIECFVLANFGSNYLFLWVFMINTLQNLAECPLVNDFGDFISVS